MSLNPHLEVAIPTMTTEIDLDSTLIDGARLRAAREARGLSVVEMAAEVTLSREQIQCIEDGGNRPFYTPAHKLLAVRKYTTALEIPYDQVISGVGAYQTIPAPEDAPAAMMSPAQMPEPSDLRFAAVERNAELRRLMTLGAIALCILLAVYAKLRGTPEDAAQDSVSEVRQTEPDITLPRPTSSPAREGSKKAEAAPKAEASVKAAADTKPEPPGKTDLAVKPAASAAEVAVKVTANEDLDCSSRISGEVKSWSPAYQRKNDSRLFVVSPNGGSLCVVDGSGKSTLLSLKPMVGQAFSGKPPYTVRSSELARMELFMQGLKVKVPSDASTLRLVPTNQPAPPEAATSPSE